ncbi:MAG: right-handed parallel beta-helix repeat-containing protein [Fibrobacter sp.]|nr:right-handed parallel beta-helix repeat-containing protein [Fibrobacter sp.]
MNKGIWFLLPVSLATAFLVSCSSSEGPETAGGTEAESTMAFRVRLSDGSAAAYARVRVLPGDFLSDGSSPAEWQESDANGFIKMEAEPGSYTVEARHVDGSLATGAVQYVALDSKNDDSKVDTIELGELSSIEGFVLLGETSPVIRVAGLDRYVVPDSTGHFVIDSLPSGTFDVQFGDPSETHSAKVESVAGDTLYVDCSDSASGINVIKSQKSAASEYPGKDWGEHDALLPQIDGYAAGTLGAAGVTDSLGEISKAKGEICIVTTTEDYIIVEDTTDVDSLGNAVTKAEVAPGSLRECAYKDGPTWVLFEKSGTYNLRAPLRLKKDKTIDGRGRDIRIAGMGVLTDVSSNLIFENLTFTAPAITALDTSSRRALSIHNGTHHVWVDHCTFEEYPLVEFDVKRGSHNVTVSWSRFENAQTGILFGLTADIVKEPDQKLTVHHSYFAGLAGKGIRAHGGELHAYNNFFADVDETGIECSDSAKCYIEKNIFDTEKPVELYTFYDEDGAPVDTSVGFVRMKSNWLVAGSEDLEGNARSYKPDYKYEIDLADAELALKVKKQSGPR